MEVYSKNKKNFESQYYVSMIMGIVLFIVPLVYILSTFNGLNSLKNGGYLLYAGMVSLFIFSLFIFYSILYSILKKPNKYKAILISKKDEMYNNMPITTMQFSIGELENGTRFDGKIIECYSTGDNNLIVDNFYLIEVKESNWKITRVEKYEGIVKKIFQLLHLIGILFLLEDYLFLEYLLFVL